MPEDDKELQRHIDIRVDEIGERVARIEGKLDDKAPKGFKKRLAEYGGLVALFLSILIGGFTLYDKLVLQPNKDSAQQEIELRNDVSELANIVARIAGLDWKNNPQAAMAESQAYSAQRLALAERIQKSASVMPEFLKFADRLLLANEYEFFGRLPEALEQAELAHQSATDSTQIATANWSKARINGHLNKMTQMRDSYALALSEFKSSGMKKTAGSVMQIYTQWVGIELSNGTCATASEAHSKMLEDFGRPDVWPQTRQIARDQFAQMLSQAPKTCDLFLDG